MQSCRYPSLCLELLQLSRIYSSLLLPVFVVAFVLCNTQAGADAESCKQLPGAHMDGERRLEDAIVYAKIAEEQEYIAFTKTVKLLYFDDLARKGELPPKIALEFGGKFPVSDRTRRNMVFLKERHGNLAVQAGICLRWLESLR